MTTYNGEKYIIKQLQSLYEQSVRMDEVVICDDASTDGTAALIETFIKENELPHWHCFVNENNLGFKRNFYQSIRKTTGEIIFLCDQDDIWDCRKIELMTQEMAKNPKITALNCSFNFMDENDGNKPVRNKRGLCNGNSLPLTVPANGMAEIPFALIAGRNYFPGCTLAITKDLKELYLKEFKENVLHDWYLNFLAAFYFDGLYFYNRPLIDYRIHAENTVGMDVVFHKTVASRSSRETRLAEVAYDEAQVRDFLATAEKYAKTRAEKVAYLQSYLDFFEAKKQALAQRSFCGILGLYRHAEVYKRYQSSKSRLMDIYAVMKKG